MLIESLESRCLMSATAVQAPDGSVTISGSGNTNVTVQETDIATQTIVVTIDGATQPQIFTGVTFLQFSFSQGKQNVTLHDSTINGDVSLGAGVDTLTVTNVVAQTGTQNQGTLVLDGGATINYDLGNGNSNNTLVTTGP